MAAHGFYTVSNEIICIAAQFPSHVAHAHVCAETRNRVSIIAHALNQSKFLTLALFVLQI